MLELNLLSLLFLEYVSIMLPLLGLSSLLFWPIIVSSLYDLPRLECALISVTDVLLYKGDPGSVIYFILLTLTPLFNFLLASISSFSISIVNSFNVFYILDSYKLSLCISYYYNYSKKFLIWNSFTSLGNTLDLFITTLTYIFSGLL